MNYQVYKFFEIEKIEKEAGLYEKWCCGLSEEDAKNIKELHVFY